MSLPIEFLPEPPSDIEVAFQWYEQRQRTVRSGSDLCDGAVCDGAALGFSS